MSTYRIENDNLSIPFQSPNHTLAWKAGCEEWERKKYPKSENLCLSIRQFRKVWDVDSDEYVNRLTWKMICQGSPTKSNREKLYHDLTSAMEPGHTYNKAKSYKRAKLFMKELGAESITKAIAFISEWRQRQRESRALLQATGTEGIMDFEV